MCHARVPLCVRSLCVARAEPGCGVREAARASEPGPRRQPGHGGGTRSHKQTSKISLLASGGHHPARTADVTRTAHGNWPARRAHGGRLARGAGRAQRAAPSRGRCALPAGITLYFKATVIFMHIHTVTLDVSYLQQVCIWLSDPLPVHPPSVTLSGMHARKNRWGG